MNQSITTISGHVYARNPRHRRSTLSTSERALLAAELVATGKVPLVEASALFHVSVGYTHTAVHASDFDRARIARGELTLSALHNHARQPSEIDRLIAEAQCLVAECRSIQAECDRLNAEYTRLDAEYDRIMRALDVAEPAPVIQAAE
jgi:hypothetical protein